MVKVAPSLLSADFCRLRDEIQRVEAGGADLLHIDVMDGHFVPNITVGPLIVEAVRRCTKLPLDVHLMISNPDQYIGNFCGAGIDFLSVHVEACTHLGRTVQAVRALGVHPAVVLNPATTLSSLEEILPEVDMVLLMSVNPGFGGQQFIPWVLDKIARLKEMLRARGVGALVEVDGGIKPDNAAQVREAGADILVAGSGIFSSNDYGEAIRRIRGG